MLRFVDLIEKKADGGKLSKEEIQEMVSGFTNGDIPDYQMSAMMMAILQRGMTLQETADLTMAMMHSGDVVDLSDLPGVKLDKHSTGGVGDTTTLVVAPLVAACGGTVAKMSGRGLGHTGGTLDKLESVPGTSVEIDMERFKDIVRENGVAVIGQTGNLVPADKKMYALRDVTATVRSIPLIASSIMSKKLASGADAIVLDVKTGSGAFMRTTEEAFELAKTMVKIGSALNRKVTALVTDMDQPLGNAIGNALEVQEAVELLSGLVDEHDPLFEVCMMLGSELLKLAGIAKDNAEAETMLKEKIQNGSGLKRLAKMIELQGGDPSYITVEGMKKLTKTRSVIDLTCKEEGYVYSLQAEKIGTAAQMLGAGRATKEDVIDPSVGIVMKVRRGNYCKAGDVLATLYVNDEGHLEDAMHLLEEAIVIKTEKPEDRPMVFGVVTEKDI